MTVALGIFDLFTYGIPGSMQLAFLVYVVARFDLVDLRGINAVPGPIQFAAIAIGSYLLGHLTYLASRVVDKVYRFRLHEDGSDAWRAVAADAAQVGDRQVPRANVMLLLAGAQLRDRDVATEVGRFRATGLMLRNAVVPTSLAMLAAIAEVIMGPHRWLAAGLGLLFALAVLAFARHGQQLRYWANTKTYQFAYWLDLSVASGDGGASEVVESRGSPESARMARSPSKP